MKPYRPQRDLQSAKNNSNICQYLKVTAEKHFNALDTHISKLGPNTAHYLEKNSKSAPFKARIQDLTNPIWRKNSENTCQYLVGTPRKHMNTIHEWGS